MLIFSCLWLLLISPSLVIGNTAADNELLTNFLNDVNHHLGSLYDKEVLANLQNELEGPNDLVALLQSEIATSQIIDYLKTIQSKRAKYKRLGLGDELQRRQLVRIPVLGYEVLGREELTELYAVTANMSDSYSNVKLCAYDEPSKCDLRLIPDVQNILHESKNLNEIEHYWFEWRRKTGASVKVNFKRFIELYRKTAKFNGFNNAADYWFRDLGLKNKAAMKVLNDIMTELRPLFLQFHAHVRGSLRKQYGERIIPGGETYPQHLAEIFLGNAFRQTQAKRFVDYPHPELGVTNITNALQQVGLSTMQRIFWNVAEYFRSLGYPMLESDFWQLVKPKAASDAAHCWHKAWQYYNVKQINFTYCKRIDDERFFNMFEALSDLYYYRAYQEQPTLLREELLPNFSDALGKFHVLAASSPRSLAKLKLVGHDATSKASRLNRVYLQGLRIIFVLPIYYVLERYRVDLLSENIDVLDYEAYWRLTKQYMGAGPPVTRTKDDFDVPAKLLMEIDNQYTSQIFSILLQFQMYHHFCTLTGQYVRGDPQRPLDLCDLSNQHVVGERIYKAMSLGASRPFEDVLQSLTGQDKISVQGLLAYFEPLHEWLAAQNSVRDLEIGWE